MPTLTTRPDDASPFHAGEQAVQTRLGVRDDIEPWARRVVRPVLTAQHRAFFADLPFVVAAARDGEGRPWATLLAGESGFVDPSSPTTLRIDASPAAGDALASSLVAGADLGLLGIDLATRRRNRVNGRVAPGHVEALVLEVGQTFGNCPQHITQRAWRRAEPQEAPPPERAERLSPQLRRWIGRADTFFIASGFGGEARGGRDETFGMDASHRGGPPGFVRVEDDRRLVFPDYAGNHYFNTIGNLVMDPRIGLLFVEFETGGMLQITGRATIDWDAAHRKDFPDAQRLVAVDIDEVVHLPRALPIRWAEPGGSVRTLRVVERRRESEDVTSFVLRARDGGALPRFEPGQHLPIELETDDEGGPLRRTYSISSGPEQADYRISVKREPFGRASRWLHDRLAPGDRLRAGAPAGEFVLEPGDRPLVLLSAGIGITPMLSMLHALAHDATDTRPVWLIHGARDGAHAALLDEARWLVSARAGARSSVSFSRPLDTDRPGSDFDRRGRVDGTLVRALVGDVDADYYLCGPAAFLSDLTTDLRRRGVPEERIHTESFGPAAG